MEDPRVRAIREAEERHNEYVAGLIEEERARSSVNGP